MSAASPGVDHRKRHGPCWKGRTDRIRCLEAVASRSARKGGLPRSIAARRSSSPSDGAGDRDPLDAQRRRAEAGEQRFRPAGHRRSRRRGSPRGGGKERERSMLEPTAGRSNSAGKRPIPSFVISTTPGPRPCTRSRGGTVDNVIAIPRWRRKIHPKLSNRISTRQDQPSTSRFPAPRDRAELVTDDAKRLLAARNAWAARYKKRSPASGASRSRPWKGSARTRVPNARARHVEGV